VGEVPRRPDLLVRRRSVGYSVVAGLLIAFGVVGILSIGLPFLIVGVLLLALAPYRHRPEVFWPPLVAVVVWTTMDLVIAPWGCSQSASSTLGAVGTAHTVVGREICRTVFGVHVSSGILAPALIALAVAVAAAVATRVVLVRRPRRSA
jgi:hypothetical protein